MQNKLINWKRNIFKSASNTFFLASLVYLKEQEILPHKKFGDKPFNLVIDKW